MLKEYKIEDKKLVETQDKHASVFVYTNPTPQEQRFLIDTYKIDEHTLASALDPDEQPRLEFEPEHTVMIYKRPKNYSGKDQNDKLQEGDRVILVFQCFPDGRAEPGQSAENPQDAAHDDVCRERTVQDPDLQKLSVHVDVGYPV